VEFSADFFNIFNHANFLDPSFDTTNPATFGVITCNAKDALSLMSRGAGASKTGAKSAAKAGAKPAPKNTP
jgi:hypothetical protein